MKKSLVLTAIAATLAAPAFAQSSVTIYGRLNVSMESQKVGDADRKWEQVDNASRIGFKGEEDLGNGNKALFVLEHGFDVSTGKASTTSNATGGFWGRESTVGLQTRYGTVRLGNLTASEAYFATADYVSMHNHDTGTSSDALFGYIVTGALQNAVAYNTPNIAGFVGHVQFGEEVAGDKPISVAANYDRGALHLGLGFEKHGDDKSTAVRGLYELGAFTVGGYFDVVKGTKEYNTWRLSGMYALGANEFHLNYGGTNTVSVSDVDTKKASQITAGYNYNLSKRTKVYAFYTKVNDDAGNFGGDFNSFALGVRHNF